MSRIPPASEDLRVNRQAIAQDRQDLQTPFLSIHGNGRLNVSRQLDEVGDDRMGGDNVGGKGGTPAICCGSGLIGSRVSKSRPGAPAAAPFLLLAAFVCAGAAAAQQPSPSPAPAPVAAPLTTPSLSGPLAAAPPIQIDAGPLGKLDVDGVVSGMGLVENNHGATDDTGQAALSNAQVWVQKPDGWWQFYVQAGAYNVLSIGLPYLSTQKNVSELWGPVPFAWLKLAPGKSTSILIGSLPPLMGAESTFGFQNMNIERGLLWNQENSVNRGVQVNQTWGKLTASLSWNDGYYSNRYSWLSGSLTYASGPHSLSFQAMGNLSQTGFETLATPVENNGSMYAVVYTWTKGSWVVQPYWQYSAVPTNAKIGVASGASTQGGAVLLTRAFHHGLALSGRGEFIASTGSAGEGSVNLMYGPGSAAWSATATPTFQKGRFFVRGDISFVHANRITPEDAFGAAGNDASQARVVVEVGFLF